MSKYITYQKNPNQREKIAYQDGAQFYDARSGKLIVDYDKIQKRTTDSFDTVRAKALRLVFKKLYPEYKINGLWQRFRGQRTYTIPAVNMAGATMEAVHVIVNERARELYDNDMTATVYGQLQDDLIGRNLRAGSRVKLRLRRGYPPTILKSGVRTRHNPEISDAIKRKLLIELHLKGTASTIKNKPLAIRKAILLNLVEHGYLRSGRSSLEVTKRGLEFIEATK